MVTFNAFSELDRVRREIDRVFDQNWNPQNRSRGRLAFLPGYAARKYPFINLREDKENFYLEALAPGIDVENLQVSITDNMVTISGEKIRNPEAIKPEAYHRSERAAGRFTRTVELPLRVNSNQVNAEYKNGILYITIPKAEEAKMKSIVVKVS